MAAKNKKNPPDTPDPDRGISPGNAKKVTVTFLRKYRKKMVKN
jgi:hypothetical protein